MTLEGLIAAHDPDAPAVIVTEANGDRILTLGDLLEGVDRWSAHLAGLRLRAGDVIAVWLPNGATWLMVELAAARLGLVIAPVNTRFQPPEVRDLLRRSGARLVIAPRAFAGMQFADRLAEALEGPAPHGAPTSPNAPQLAWAIHTHDDELPPRIGQAHAAVADDLMLNLFTTSGSTGAPKLAMHHQSDLVIRFSAAAERFDIRPGDRVLCALPLCGVWGLGIALAALMAGATAVLTPLFDPDEAAETMARLKITHVHGGDNLILSILDSSLFASERLTAWRGCCFGAFTGQPGLQTLRRIEASAPALRATQAYGSSEGLAFIAGAPAQAPEPERALAGGAPTDALTRMRVVVPGEDAPATVGDEGEIQISGPTVTRGYFADEAATDASFTPDGWFRTGDLGRATQDGAVFIARMGDALRLRGNLVDPGEIERVLCGHPQVAEAHVVGATLAGQGDLAVAFVGPTRPGVETNLLEEDLAEWCRARLARFKQPARIIVTTDLPRVIGANGAKIQKGVLRQRAQACFSTPPRA